MQVMIQCNKMVGCFSSMVVNGFWNQVSRTSVVAKMHLFPSIIHSLFSNSFVDLLK